MPLEDWKWWKAQGIQESGLKPEAQSYCGAMGIMQLMPRTAEELGVNNPWNPEQNIQGGIKYDRQMFKIFKDRDLMFASYNCGAGNIKRAQKKANAYYWNDIFPYLSLVTGRHAQETIGYVKRINKIYKIL